MPVVRLYTLINILLININEFCPRLGKLRLEVGARLCLFLCLYVCVRVGKERRGGGKGKGGIGRQGRGGGGGLGAWRCGSCSRWLRSGSACW